MKRKKPKKPTLSSLKSKSGPKSENKPKKVLWEPNPGKQTEAMTRLEKEILYGGRRGGGKTDALILWLTYDIEEPRYRALVIRKNAEDLSDWVDRAKFIYTKLGAVATGNPTKFVFPSGATIRTGHLKDEKAYTKYQGHEYHKMGIEELTQIPSENNYEMLISSCRSTIESIDPQIFSTCNPDGPGFAWVKKRWNLKGIPKEIVVVEVIDAETGAHLDRVFIPAGIKDNPHLDKDPGYRAFLNSLKDGIRQAWRDGSWDDPVIEGAYFTQELLTMKKENRIKFIPYDPQLKVHLVWDLGIGDVMSIGFVQRTAKDVTIIDYYENEGFGPKHYWDMLEDKRKEKKYIYGTYYLPHDATHRKPNSDGEVTTVETIFREAGHKPIEVISKTNNLSSDHYQVRLMFPQLYINEQACAQFTNAIQNYRKVWNDKMLKYDDSPVHDWASHAATVLRSLARVYRRMINDTAAPPKRYREVKRWTY